MEFEVQPGDIPQLAFSGIALPIIVWLLIKALVYVELFKTGQQKRIANIALSLLGGLVWLLVNFIPETGPVVGLVVVALVGSLGSALLYTRSANGNGDK